MIGGDLLFVHAPHVCNSIDGNRLFVCSPACACAHSLLCELFNGRRIAPLAVSVGVKNVVTN